MAKDITLKTRNGETRYPKSVTALIFENATGKTLQTIIDEMRQVDSATDTRTQHFKADVNNLDTLKNKTDIGLYNYVGTGWRGSVSVCYDSADNVSQVALSSSTPSYNGNTLTWISAQPCAMARTYRNGAWSHWEKVGAPVVNDLTTGGTDKALSAEMGKELKSNIDALGPKIDGFSGILATGPWEIGSISPASSHIDNYSSNTRIRMPEQTCHEAGDYMITCDSGYEFLVYVVGKITTASWATSRKVTMAKNDLWRIALRQSPEVNYSSYTQEQIKAAGEASGLKIQGNVGVIPNIVKEIDGIKYDIQGTKTTELCAATHSTSTAYQNLTIPNISIEQNKKYRFKVEQTGTAEWSLRISNNGTNKAIKNGTSTTTWDYTSEYDGDSLVLVITSVTGSASFAVTAWAIEEKNGVNTRLTAIEGQMTTLGSSVETLSGEVAGKMSKSEIIDTTPNPNLFDTSAEDYKTGKYISTINSDGSLYLGNNESYDTSGEIAVEPSTKYSLYDYLASDGSYYGTASMRFVAYIGADHKAVEPLGSALTSFTTPEWCHYVRITVSAGSTYNKMLIKGETPPQQYINSDTDTLKPEVIGNNSIGQEKLKNEFVSKVNNLAYPATNGMLSKFDLDDGDEETLPENSVKNRKGMCFSATISTLPTGWTLTMGHGKNVYASNWIVIDATSVKVYGYSSSASLVKEVTHGLTFANNIQVKIDKKDEATAHISICSNGTRYQFDTSWNGDAGTPFVASSGASMTNCSLGWFTDNIIGTNWLFGDSYFSMASGARWTYHLLNDGHTKNLLDAHGGEHSNGAMTELQNLLLIGKPKRIVWCLGQNDVDSSSAVNSTWNTAYTQLKTICEAQGIELVLATIPCVSGGEVEDSEVPATFRNHNFKNAIVRASGLRYIDFEKAVGADSTYGTWYNGMLSEDGVHPTQQGARALYYQALADCPELMTFGG